MSTPTSHFTSQQWFYINAEKSCVLHLIDLMREYGGETLGDAKAAYRSRCELDIDPGPVNVTTSVKPYFVERSFVGSQFADTV